MGAEWMQWGMTAVMLALAVPAAADPLAEDVLAEINHVRANPQGFAGELRAYRQLFRGRLVADGSPGGMMTREGVAAVDEAIRVLERQPPLAPLQRGQVLARAAQDHADDQGPRGLVGHQSADGASPSARVVARGGGPYVAETISYGSATARGVVRQLVVDDGVADRGHRKVIFSTEMRFAGAGCGRHEGYRAMCVVDFARTPDGRAR